MVKEITIKGNGGLGDAFYLHPILKYKLKHGNKIILLNDFPELFEDLDLKIIPAASNIPANTIYYRYSYCQYKNNSSTNQYEDLLKSANINEYVDFEFPWTVKNDIFTDNIKKMANGRKIFLIAVPYKPFGIKTNFGKEIQFNYKIIQDFINKISNDYFIIQIGKDYLRKFINCHADFVNKLDIKTYIDLISISDICISQVGNMLPICESMNKKIIIYFSKIALEHDNPFINSITPQKVIVKKELVKYFIDNESLESIQEKFNAICR